MPSPHSRRDFLRFAAAVPAVVAAGSLLGPSLTPSVRAAAAPTSAPLAPARRVPRIGIELYAVRGELMRDLPNTLRTVAAMGYETVEFYSPYTGWTFPYAKEVRAQLDDLGLRCWSTHNGAPSLAPGEIMDRAIELNQILGTRTLVLASAPRGVVGAEAWKTYCGQLTAATTRLLSHGLTAGYHNHQTEWAKVEGDLRIMDLIAANTPTEFVLQLDVGTCVAAGADPVAWIKANPGRIRSVHLKDWAPGTAAEEKAYRVLFSEGVAPWREIITAAEATGGVEFYLMEQEGSRYPEFETAKRCLETWRALRAALS